MATILWSQDIFSKGELSPLLYSRITLNAYYQGLKRAKNVITYPQGSAGARFGTDYRNTISGVTNYNEIFFKSFQYLNECCYLVLIKPDAIDIYLEDFLVATVTSTGIGASDIRLIDHTVLDNRFRITTGVYRPKDLVRSANAANAITGQVGNTLTVTNALTQDGIWPARFTTTGALPTTTPQIHVGRTYFVRAVSTTSIQIYSSSQDAANNVNAFTISSAGSGTNNLVILNNWSLNNVSFRNYPQFDFTGGYDNITFTPNATSGSAVTLTASGAIFTAAHVGGAFVGGGGIARITAVGSSTTATVATERAFDSTAAISGRLSLLTEPAWSDDKGWPRKCSSFGNRAYFANSDTLPNGLWGSVVNDYNDFNDIVPEDDFAISWLPTSDTINYIQFIVPYRSLTIHTNSGVWSTPLSLEAALTPTNFFMSVQDSTPAQQVQPQPIDNQIIVLSGNDAHSLLWDGFNSAYTSNIISVANEQLIREPIDQAYFIDLHRAGSRYMFIVNENGTVAIYQTLLAEQVSGFVPAVLEQSYGNAYFRWVTSNFDGRAWFITERELAEAATPVSITGNTNDTFEATGSNLSTDSPTAVTFSATTSLPTTSPQIEEDTWYWAIGVDANHFKVYLTQHDANEDVNSIEITDFGDGASVNPYPLATNFFIEEVNFDSYVDCAGFYEGSSVSTIAGQTRFNAQEIVMQGDGFGFTDLPINGDVVFRAHGQEQEVSQARFGFPINVEIEPMPVAMSLTGNPKNSNLIEPKHIRVAAFMFVDTIGGTINGTPIALNTLNQTMPGSPPQPKTGLFEMTMMKGWNELQNGSFVIRHSEPFPFQLTGIFYKVEV